MGVFGMLVPNDDGFGGGGIEAAIIFEQFGAHLATGPLLWSTIAAPLLPDAGTGRVRVAGIDVGSRAPYVIEHAAESDALLMIAHDGVTWCPTSALADPVDGEQFDPLTPTRAYLDLPTGASLGGPEEAKRLRLAGTVLAAAQLVGVAQGALDVASAYARERQQFGVPIGSFQAVKHLLADMYVRVELARSATYAAAAVFDDNERRASATRSRAASATTYGAGDAATAASAAKVLAGEAGIANGRTAVQVLGGMGFTWEMPAHYFLKRAWVLEESFGTGDTHALALSDALEPAARRAVATWT
jgi:hypothetical protein